PFGLDDRWWSTVGRRHVAVIGRVQFGFPFGRVVIYCGDCHMSSSKRVGGRKVNSDGDDPTENNKAVADHPPAVTASPLQLISQRTWLEDCCERARPMAVKFFSEDVLHLVFGDSTLVIGFSYSGKIQMWCNLVVIVVDVLIGLEQKLMN
ncbi:hypothetical protein T10_1914, partial [Trichinella papuae]